MNSLLSAAVMLLLTQVSHSLPTFYHRGWLRLLHEGDGCGVCQPELCPPLAVCVAGTVQDGCDCCPECGNAEGQICDLDHTNHFYGRCGENLECQLDINVLVSGDIPEPQCTCRSQESVCASDGMTYSNICRMKEAFHSGKHGNLSLTHDGPCESGNHSLLCPNVLFTAFFSRLFEHLTTSVSIYCISAFSLIVFPSCTEKQILF